MTAERCLLTNLFPEFCGHCIETRQQAEIETRQALEAELYSFAPEKWAHMNRAERRAAMRGKR